jgi:hypothetical protein
MRKALLLGVALALAFTGAAYAQETTSGTIAGQVLDPQGAAVPGATVTVISPQGEKTYTTDGEGHFIAPFLVPGMYDVRVELTGFKTVEQKGIMVRLGQRSRLDFTLAVSQVQETVEVVGASPVIDLSSTTAGGVMDSDMLKQLPVGRNFTQTLYLVPGVSDSSGVGAANPSISGASGLENNYVVDGVNITNQGFGGVGVYSIVFGSLGTGVTTDFIKETQVKTAGFEAEYGQATGGVVNVVTKSGTNQFHGSLFGYWDPEALEADWNDLQTPNGSVDTKYNGTVDAGVTVGGPLVRDKLFFFGAYNPQWQRRKFIAPADAENFPLRSLGEVTRERNIRSYAGKITWQATSNHRFDVSFFGDPSEGPNGIQRPSALKAQTTSQFSAIDSYGGHNQSVRYDGILSPNWFLEGRYAHATTFFSETPSQNTNQTTDRTVDPWVTYGGIGYGDKAADGRSNQFSLISTNIVNGAGTHQFRYGVGYEDVGFIRDIDYTGTPFQLADGQTTRGGARVYIQADPSLPTGKYYRVVRAYLGAPADTVQKYLNWFAQDTWQINNKLTIKAGIRWERQELDGGQPICYTDESLVGAGDGTPGNETNCTYTWSNNWGPRLGLIWDPTGNGKTKLYANYGRFYVKIPNDLAARALAGDPAATRADYYDEALTDPIPDGVEVGDVTRHLILAGGSPSTFANDSKSTYTDEYLVGFEVEAAPMLNLGVRWIHRNISTVLEDYAQASPVMYDAGFPGTDDVYYYIDNISADLYTLDPSTVPGYGYIPRPFFEDPEHVYDSVEFTATKSYSDNWSLFASYRWSKLDGNFEGFFRSDNGQSDPAITSLFDFPTDDPSYTSIGVPDYGYLGDIRYQGTTLGSFPLPNTRPHQFRFYGNYTTGGLSLGIGADLGSGRILTALAANPTYGNAGEIPLTGRGGGFDTVDGFMDTTNFETVINVHVSYTFNFGQGGQRLMLIADVFNLLNDQDALWYDTDVDSGLGSVNPNFGQPTNGGNSSYPAYRAPLSTRLGVRFEW